MLRVVLDKAFQFLLQIHFEKCLIFYSSLTKINEKTVRFECNRTVFNFLFPRY